MEPVTQIDLRKLKVLAEQVHRQQERLDRIAAQEKPPGNDLHGKHKTTYRRALGALIEAQMLLGAAVIEEGLIERYEALQDRRSQSEE